MTTTTTNRFAESLLIAAGLSLCLVGFAAPRLALAEEGEAPAAPEVAAAPLWSKNCKSCHGDDGKGQTKAGKMKKVKDLTDAEVRAKFDRERMIKSVTDGITNEAGKSLMKAYSEKLNATEITALVDFIFALPH